MSSYFTVSLCDFSIVQIPNNNTRGTLAQTGRGYDVKRHKSVPSVWSQRLSTRVSAAMGVWGWLNPQKTHIFGDVIVGRKFFPLDWQMESNYPVKLTSQHTARLSICIGLTKASKLKLLIKYRVSESAFSPEVWFESLEDKLTSSMNDHCHRTLQSLVPAAVERLCPWVCKCHSWDWGLTSSKGHWVSAFQQSLYSDSQKIHIFYIFHWLICF